MKKSILLIICLIFAQNIFSQTGNRRFFKKTFSVKVSAPLELTDDLGQSLIAGNMYRVQLLTTGTGTRNGAEYVVWYNNVSALWEVRAVNMAGSISNHPSLIVDNNIVKVTTMHTTGYLVAVFVEEIIANATFALPNMFGAEYQWQRMGANLFYTDGNVAIGTTPSVNKLDVNGTIHAKEVKVDMEGWPDYVFKKEYDLPTLEQVETHINEKGYLINMPSEAEVQKEGINLGDMNAKLLQKIEELTLYVIDINKKVNELESNNTRLSNENKILAKKVEKIRD